MLHAGVLLACAGSVFAAGVPLEPPIVPTVHPAILPSTALPVPLVIRADHTSVWRVDLEQRMLVSGRVVIGIGYRSLRADSAAIWLTPSSEAGEGTYDVAIYLSGNARVAEGDRPDSTVSTTDQLLVTTRISRAVELGGSNPTPEIESNNPIVKKGDALRLALLNRPAPPIYIPHIVTTSEEQALQSGWIAKGPNNRVISGPGELRIVRGPNGHVISVEGAPGNKKPIKPRPEIIATGESVHSERRGNEMVTVIRGAFLLSNSLDNKPPLVFHAQRMVLFSPLQKEGDAATRPARGGSSLTSQVTGAYLEGDVTLESGPETLRASKLYYDFTTNRAIMLDATLSTVDEVRRVPLYLRAAEIRQLSRSEFAAKKANFSTSEFHTPHYSIGASDIYLQDITPRDESGKEVGLKTYAFKAKDATVDVQDVPVFYWPYLAGNTSKNEIPLRRLRVSNSKTYGLSIQTDWDFFALAGQTEPKGVRADLNLDYFGKRGPAAGVQATWDTDDSNGLLRSYIMSDKGQDQLGFDRQDIPVQDDTRGRITARHRQDLGDGWTLSLEGSYISDPNFLEEYFPDEFNNDKEHETSAYLKKQGETDALTFLGKFDLFDFTATADQVDDQYSTEKEPELKYWRIGDSLGDLFTYYSESGAANLHTNITNDTPDQLGLLPTFVGPPAAVVPLTMTYREYYKTHGWTTGDVLRGDTRHEIDMPLQIGDLKITPYVTGRLTAWNDAFPDSESSGDTTRLWGQVGMRGSMAFWKVYSNVNSTFWDVHHLRHIIEPEFTVFATGDSEDRAHLQPFDDSEQISKASGASLSINQKWQTKRGGEGHWRNVDWLVFNVQVNQFWDKDQPSVLFPYEPLRGFLFTSRPELSLVQDSVAADGVWRVGEWARLLGEANYNTDKGRLEQFAAGVAVDQTSTLSYFFGNRYVRGLDTDEWTVAANYQLTRKYQFIAAESYDFNLRSNILSSLTVVRKLPRFNVAVTATYDADQHDTTFIFTAWPEGFPELGFGNRSGSSSSGGAASK